jgi:hypothetical protein
MSPSIQKAQQPVEAPSDDTSIPVLTERLTLPPLELDTTLPPEAPLQIDTSLPRELQAQDAPPERAVSFTPPAAVMPPRPALPPVPTPLAPAVAPLAPAGAEVASGSHWTRIEVELRSSILQAVADSLPQEVDAIVRSRMSDAIDRLVAQLAAETRLAMAASLREIVDHAVRAELARLRSQKR